MNNNMNDDIKDDQKPASNQNDDIQASADDQIKTADVVATPPDQPPETSTPADQPAQDYGQIEVQQYDVPHKRPLASLEETLGERPAENLPGELEDQPAPPEKKVVNFRPAIMPPIKAVNENRGVTIATTMMIIVLVAGFAAGYGGYQYFQGQITSADTETTPSTESPKTIETDATPTGTTSPDATANWTNYENTKNKFTLKYPDTWYGLGTDSPTSSSIQLTSFKPAANASGGMTEGQKIEVIFQETNGKTLNDWMTANNAAMAAKVTDTKKTTVGTKEASQQTFSEPIKSIGTYLIHNDKVMIISYYAAENDFDKGVTIYEDIINSVKLD